MTAEKDQSNRRSPRDSRPLAAKISISMPSSMVDFIDEQCDKFQVGRSAYLQLLLEAEQSSPRQEFTKKARSI